MPEIKPGSADPGLERLRPCADAQTMAVLELGPLLERVASLAVSPLGAQRARALRPCPDMAGVARRQRRLSQLRQLMAEQGRPSLDGLDDVRPLLNRLGPVGAFLVPEELEVMADFLSAAGRAASFLAPSEERMDELFRLANQITSLPELAKELRRVIGPGHSVSSNASPELARVRREAARSRERLRGELMGLVQDESLAPAFSDQVVTQRAGRFVVPVRSDAKGRVAGIIHDTSGSGATCFVEPLSAVEGNNQLALMTRREREEEIKVLVAVAARLAQESQALHENLAALAKLDCLLAQARFADRLDCAEPVLTAADEVELIKARHPLLAWRAAGGRGSCVPIDLRVSPEQRMLVLSGANAGGKTASLKTLGLITLMVMCGLHAPLDRGSRVAVFNTIAAEIGDDQDLDRDLSTFTAHAGRLAQMVSQAGPSSLFLIDEIGGGTDPSEGSALATAVLDWLGSKGSMVLATTHFHRLKAYATLHKGAQNVSVSFDQATGQATYQLHYGAPGFSDALAVAARLGFPREILEAAGAELDQAERQTVALLREADQARQEARQERAAASADRLAAKGERDEARGLKRQAAQERAGALAEGKRRVREVAKRFEGELASLLGHTAQEQEQGRQIKEGAVRQELYQARRQALAQVEATAAVLEAARPAGTEDIATGLKEGDAVELANLGQQGVLLESPSPGRGTVPVSVGVAGVRVMVPLAEIKPLPAGSHTSPRAKAKGKGVSVQASAGEGLDLNLIGKRVDEALPLVDKALDQALLAGRGEIRVVHGMGTGRLRAAVREYLAAHPVVASFRPGQRGEGGAGVTVAQVRQ
ncbi:MAG: Smr/MutS family protein [Proteobacteria bacterium]|nr:Smr/MutS family protein [Pseudomonadota bacterium]MBU1452534.1 Smr/MutS family protein [Pseudomonadota bacterium]MBU2468938.1 Smr/MutS family protein [Pseudomonadota bacterium]MBU2518638.1 Smr/MutS family protein [Pseudomonadota bacterium]